jgi:hypothetical protein
LFLLSVEFSFQLSASFVPGVENILADGISRLHSWDEALKTRAMLSNNSNAWISCKTHMSPIAFIELQDLWRRSCQS